MSLFIRFFSSLVTALPATVIWILISRSTGSEYFWKAYFIASGAFLAASAAFGFYIPALAPAHWKRHPALWLFGQGLLGWLVAVLALGLANLSPLCVGQDNGDGSNDLASCLAQTVLVSIVSTPLEFILLCLAALPGGWRLKRLIKSEGG
jgi:hypothetical protein